MRGAWLLPPPQRHVRPHRDPEWTAGTRAEWGERPLLTSLRFSLLWQNARHKIHLDRLSVGRTGIRHPHTLRSPPHHPSPELHAVKRHLCARGALAPALAQPLHVPSHSGCKRGSSRDPPKWSPAGSVPCCGADSTERRVPKAPLPGSRCRDSPLHHR